ncbi:hypothetical protein J5N97_014295 [Dioscorea zingiberensis]|uniref:2,3-bisphosphoglycerate-dependent phosphoglycerate mutase n=1 Tax=Dioscorea zingiberensis TaxID=325984 RepID=A0A9D5CSA0_9LILI|nr:hypothetical protein J5N97_000447 [Dioscorea zingiberensis]KAJ0978804.1 hypothetical protein J5N97_014278 [Dioscorea zingiberensis]KAJ0978821.1 hypothetical protein J5N97_014295 [Dioscorea zingiberensis]
MTQKGSLFKGQQKRKTIPPNRHGKAASTRKGKRFVKPSKITKDMDVDRELTKFINQCNEIKAATAAQKEGGQLNIIKVESDSKKPDNQQEA